MKNYGKVYSNARPQEVEFTTNAVFVASNIAPYSKELDGHLQEGYEYDYIEYSLQEYLVIQNNKLSELTEELAAAKILLGVD